MPRSNTPGTPPTRQHPPTRMHPPLSNSSFFPTLSTSPKRFELLDKLTLTAKARLTLFIPSLPITLVLLPLPGPSRLTDHISTTSLSTIVPANCLALYVPTVSWPRTSRTELLAFPCVPSILIHELSPPAHIRLNLRR